MGVDLRLSSNGMNRFDEVASDAATQRGQGAASSAVAAAQAVNVAKAPRAWPYEHPKHGGEGPNHGRCRPNVPALEEAVQAFDGCPLKEQR